MFTEISAEGIVPSLHTKVLFAAAKLFLENGYSHTSTREIARAADIDVSAMNRHFHTKGGILAELVKYVLEGQFTATRKKLAGITDDKLLFYAAETTLQLYMAESSENIRDIYVEAYSLPETSAIIRQTITGKLEDIFKEHLPDLATRDFYKLEIASGGIMRGFLTVPCDMWFTMEQKVEAFLKCTFKIYDVPEEKIREAVAFVSAIDFKQFAQMTIDEMLKFLEANSPTGEEHSAD